MVGKNLQQLNRRLHQEKSDRNIDVRMDKG